MEMPFPRYATRLWTAVQTAGFGLRIIRTCRIANASTKKESVRFVNKFGSLFKKFTIFPCSLLSSPSNCLNCLNFRNCLDFRLPVSGASVSRPSVCSRCTNWSKINKCSLRPIPACSSRSKREFHKWLPVDCDQTHAKCKEITSAKVSKQCNDCKIILGSTEPY